MKLNDERSQVRRVAANFRAQYGAGSYGFDGRGVFVGDELLKIDTEKATAEEIAELIGNATWVTQRQCDECGKTTWQTIQLGQEPDYESATATICADCLREALKLIEST